MSPCAYDNFMGDMAYVAVAWVSFGSAFALVFGGLYFTGRACYRWWRDHFSRHF